MAVVSLHFFCISGSKFKSEIVWKRKTMDCGEVAFAEVDNCEENIMNTHFIRGSITVQMRPML